MYRIFSLPKLSAEVNINIWYTRIKNDLVQISAGTRDI